MNPADPLSDLYPRTGDEPFTRLVAGFYAQVRGDDLLGPMYPDNDWDGAEHRLRHFLIQRCGGPDAYARERGHPRLRMRHGPFAIDRPARDRWMQLMTASLPDAGFTHDDQAMLHAFFDQVATHMMNR